MSCSPRLVDTLARVAMALEEKGLVLLAQRRTREGYAYIAIKAQPPKEPKKAAMSMRAPQLAKRGIVTISEMLR